MFSRVEIFCAITSSTKYTERDGSAMVYNLASALKCLHALSIVHRDIKPGEPLEEVRGPCLSVPTLASPPLKWQKSHADSLVQTEHSIPTLQVRAKRI